MGLFVHRGNQTVMLLGDVDLILNLHQFSALFVGDILDENGMASSNHEIFCQRRIVLFGTSVETIQTAHRVGRVVDLARADGINGLVSVGEGLDKVSLAKRFDGTLDFLF